MAAQDQAVGVVWARTCEPGWVETIFAVLAHALVGVAGVIVAVRAR